MVLCLPHGRVDEGEEEKEDEVEEEEKVEEEEEESVLRAAELEEPSLQTSRIVRRRSLGQRIVPCQVV